MHPQWQRSTKNEEVWAKLGIIQELLQEVGGKSVFSLAAPHKGVLFLAVLGIYMASACPTLFHSVVEDNHSFPF